MSDETIRGIVDWACIGGLLLCEAASLAFGWRWLILACGFGAALIAFEGFLAATGTTRR